MKLARGSHVEPLLPVRLAIGFPQPGHQSHPWPEESYRPCGPWYLAQRTGPILKLNGKVIWSLFLSRFSLARTSLLPIEPPFDTPPIGMAYGD